MCRPLSVRPFLGSLLPFGLGTECPPEKMPLPLFIQCPLISCLCLLGRGSLGEPLISGREFTKQSTVSSDQIFPQLVLIQCLVPVCDYAETILTKVTHDG